MTSEEEEGGPTPEGTPDPEEDPEITAVYTYIGQYTDHDLTFDPTSQLRRPPLSTAQIDALADFRTPRFDLDNLYGRGPADQPYLYKKDGIRMQLGKRMSGNPFDPDARDLPRGPNGRALIGDPRNDELVIGKATADDQKKPLAEIARGFSGRAPLWAYILSEAQVTSWQRAKADKPDVAENNIPVKLGPVGGRIVAEVFAALLRGDPTSYLNKETAFEPIPKFTYDGQFGLAELINVALGRTP